MAKEACCAGCGNGVDPCESNVYGASMQLCDGCFDGIEPMEIGPGGGEDEQLQAYLDGEPFDAEARY